MDSVRRLSIIVHGHLHDEVLRVVTVLTVSLRRKFFPPTEEDLELDEEESVVESELLAAQLPDVPTKVPAEEGQPEAKKQKVVHVTLDQG